MFFQASDRNREVTPIATRPVATGEYAPLRQAKAKPGSRYNLPLSTTAAPVRIDSPATDVMTDLRRVNAVTIDPDQSIVEANQAMIGHRVRALFVVDSARHVFGIITSTDILGEKPIKFSQERGFRYADIVVRDIMTPADRLEILDFNDVQSARVGDVIATLSLSGRQHALAVEAGEEGPFVQRTIRGIFSLTQIARQLGIPAQHVHDIARTFAEIEAVIAS
jgi:CBS domain-containing protein